MTSIPPESESAAPDPSSTGNDGMLKFNVSASPGFAPLLSRLGICLLVTTYDAGRLIVLRAAGDMLNVHFVTFGRAMGVAVSPARLAIGTTHYIHDFWNMPSLCARLPASDVPGAAYDACYIPRHIHVTGMIDVHEMAWGEHGLWFINTFFSCLCTLDQAYSFVPRWRPPFVRKLSADDHCHLNGLAMYGGHPRFATAFATTDEPQGWRPGRKTSGVLMEIPSGEIIAHGLSMPHSPRVHRDQLWVLESGNGTLAHVDGPTGKTETVAALAGYTRGLDFHGDYAFVGLSQMREESKLFADSPSVTPDRYCGIEVLNLATGRREAHVKFEAGVHEVFAVQVLAGIRFPEILMQDDPLVTTAFGLSPEALAAMR